MVVRKGKHAKRVFGGGTLSVVAILLVVASLAAGGTAIAAYRYDATNSRRILPGVTVAGVNVSGMTRGEAAKAVRAKAELTLGKDVTINAGDESWTVTPGDLGLHADVGSAVDDAVGVTDSFGFFSRVYHRALGSSVEAGVKLKFASKRAKIDAFVDEIARSVATPARNASVALSDDGSHVVFERPHPGSALNLEVATGEIREALRKRERDVRLAMAKVPPKVTEENLGYTIVVSRPKNMLYLYRGYEIAKSWGVATAMPEFETPPGTWEIVSKAANPTWVNPAPDGWGAGAPAEIAPGPGNPLGTRALYLNAPGIRIHGTYDSGSIGTYASHGCIRMDIADSEELYDMVSVGTPVLII